jgi:hypothetical protein
MGKATLSLEGTRFLINGKPVYAELEDGNPEALGLLFNQRMIQGVFEDKEHRANYGRDGFEPEKNTENLVSSLPLWHAYGLRAITVGLQGGCPVGLLDARCIDNNPFHDNGNSIDRAYPDRLDRIVPVPMQSAWS